MRTGASLTAAHVWLLLLPAASLPAAPILFVAMDADGSGTTNAADSRNLFFLYLNGTGTESFEGRPTCFDCGPHAMTFGGGLTGQLTGNLASVVSAPTAQPVAGGGTRLIRTESHAAWTMTFSQKISALGFFVNDAFHAAGDPAIPSLFQLTIGGLATISLDPGDYGIPRNANFTSFVGFIDFGSTYSAVSFEHLDEFFGRINTDLVTAATPDQAVPEPAALSLLLMGATGLAAAARWRTLS